MLVSAEPAFSGRDSLVSVLFQSMESFDNNLQPELIKPPSSRPRYVRIDFDVRRRLNLTLTEYALLGMVEVLSRKTGWCFASRGYLAETLGISDRSVRRALAQLRERGLVEGARSLRPTERFEHARRQANTDEASGISGQFGR